jgi:hypothetical protein
MAQELGVRLIRRRRGLPLYGWTICMTLSVHSHIRRILMLLICIPAMVAIDGCERTGTTARSGLDTAEIKNSKPVVNQPARTASAPLLLDDEETEASDEPAADNNRCFVCHINYAEEQIAANHARRNIGCVHCHGTSDAHIADESWGSGGNGTAPDIMYPRDKINPACMTCHPRDKMQAPQHELAFAKSDPKVCTDCHGDHRLPRRRCKWR